MDFLEVIEQARAVLQNKGRITYRTLKRQFALDDEALDDLKFELIEGQEVAVDKDGKMLVWAGDGEVAPSPSPIPNPQPPASYTPQHLAERIRAEQQAMASRGSTDGERKTITALFADLKGSTALIEGLDPEEARSIIDPALQLMMDAVHRYDGYVAQALGDGIFALFGAPLAHEDHPQRALYAALRMQEEMRGYGDKLREQGRPPLLMRVGLNTGEVVVRSIRKDDLHADYVPVGHSTNLAARMEQLAAPGSILVTEQTQRLTDGYFEFKDLGKTQVKGADEPLNVYEVLGAGPLRTRLQVSARRGLTRFVGRHSEMDQLQRALDQAKAGHGQIVGVMGEPGLGKSRLFYEFQVTSQSDCLVLEAVSVSHGKASSFLPLIELLKDYFQLEPTDDERTRRAKIMGHVLALDKSLEETLPYLLVLLGIDDPDSSIQQMDAQVRRTRTFEALKKLFLRESLNQPLILIFEDLHWIDAETQGFLNMLSESVASAQLLLLVNYRPEYQHEWGQKTYYTQLRLAPLGKAEAIQQLTTALALLPTLPETQARVEQELTVQISAGGLLLDAKGYADPEVEAAYGRARDLCQQLGDATQLFPVLAGLWVFHHMRAGLETARGIGQEMLGLARHTEDPLLLARAYTQLGATLSFLGEQTAARSPLEQGLAQAGTQPLHGHGFISIENPALDNRSHLARHLWLLGYPDQALQRGSEAVALAQEHGHASALAVPLTFAAWTHVFRGEGQQAQELAQALLALADEHGFTYHAGTGRIMLGRALVIQGQLEKGRSEFQQGWEMQQATGSGLVRPYNLGFLADTVGKLGQPQEGLALLEEALSVVAATGEAWWEAELYRLKGELLLMTQSQGVEPAVQKDTEECFLQAIQVARKQDVKSLELRAATSLARLWQQQGKKTEAHDLLAPVYNWFTEGFDTADLKDAKALLEELR